LYQPQSVIREYFMSKLDYQLASEIIIFGALGDLSRRKLLPSLYQLEVAGLIHDDSRIIGAARQEHTLEEFKEIVLENLNLFVKEALDKDVVEKFLARMVYQQLNFKDSSSFTQLSKTVENANTTRIYYFSTAPSLYGAKKFKIYVSTRISKTNEGRPYKRRV
jgi:glucose-6-phosphate 1-dehydrogenase